jgi:hypothetical protein
MIVDVALPQQEVHTIECLCAQRGGVGTAKSPRNILYALSRGVRRIHQHTGGSLQRNELVFFSLPDSLGTPSTNSNNGISHRTPKHSVFKKKRKSITLVTRTRTARGGITDQQLCYRPYIAHAQSSSSSHHAWSAGHQIFVRVHQVFTIHVG